MLDKYKEETSIDEIGKVGTLANGGKGSGNWGHSGRPGLVGGSGKGALVHPDLRWVVTAGRRGDEIDMERLLSSKAVQNAMKRSAYEKNTLEEYAGDKKREALQNELADRLVDDKVNGAMRKNEEGKKVYDGEVAQERKAFIVIGPPAAGKSSVFADPLSRDNKARIVDSDTVKGWLPEFDKGFGAGRVQAESDKIMQAGLAKAIANGDNIVLPKIGGKSVLAIAKQLKDSGYSVSLHYNEVKTNTSIARAMSRFAETGRFLDPSYLKSIGDKPKNTFKSSANEKSLFDYAEWKNNDVKFGQEPKLIWKSGDDTKKLK